MAPHFPRLPSSMLPLLHLQRHTHNTHPLPHILPCSHTYYTHTFSLSLLPSHPHHTCSLPPHTPHTAKTEPRQFEPLLAAAASAGFALDTSSSKALADSLDGAVRPDDKYFNTLVRMMATR